MTQEDKAKAYDRVSKEVKDFFEGRQKMYSDVSQTLEYLFPELKESEDEKIRKELIDFFQDWHKIKPSRLSVNVSDILAWLEKQGEKKPTDKVEPKFKVGDRITKNSKKSCPAHSSIDDTICEVAEVHDTCYILNTKEGRIQEPFEWQDYYELVEPAWSEEDEKIRKELIDYINRLTASPLYIDKYNAWITWLEKQEGCEYIKKDWLEHIKQSWYKEGFIDGKYTPKELTINDAATLNELIDFLENGTAKLQHDLTLYANWLKTQFPPIEKQGENKPIIEMITPEESLGIDSETYKKIVDECIYGDDKQNLAWGEEDECYMSECIGAIATKDGWSFEEKRKTKHWLKSLKDRYTWKPSDEQMDALYTYIYNPQYFNTPDPRMELVISVYEDLKKLKGE